MIKFRAWDKGNRIYLYNVQDAYDTLSGFVKYDDGEDADYDEECFGDFLNDKQYDVEQYTGLHDADGNEIWEGDILRNQNNREWLCEFRHGAFIFIPKIKSGELAKFMVDDIFTIMDNSSHAVVVGNKFEGVEE